jgi:hypothetical protein
MAKKPTKLQENVNLALTIVVIFLMLVMPPIMCGLLYLSRVPDVTLGGSDNLSYTRIWMYRERRPIGLGFESRRVIRRLSETEACVQNSLRFFLWAKSDRAEATTSNLKMVLVDDRWQPAGEPCG